MRYKFYIELILQFDLWWPLIVLINQSDFSFSNEAILIFSSYLSNHPLMNSDLDMWPFNPPAPPPINKWWFSCSIYDSTLVEIHTTHVEVIGANPGPVFTATDSNRGQSDHYVFPAKTGDTTTTTVLWSEIFCIKKVHLHPNLHN